jgi:hypothetical protein
MSQSHVSISKDANEGSHMTEIGPQTECSDRRIGRTIVWSPPSETSRGWALPLVGLF